MVLAPGTRLGPYRIDAELGAGGMGHVFRATDTRLDRAVAVKVLPPHRWTDPDLRLRFQREARALSSLSHPNLCPLYDVGELPQSAGSSVPYIVMELLEGETLRQRLDEHRLSTRKALLWAAQIAKGLAAAHAKGVIHRDLKPENVFITEGELLKILDFGLATTTVSNDTVTALRTEPGIVMGTAHYMSPEQVRGAPLDARSDIFSLGIVLFEMLTGNVPFSAPSAVETMNAILVDDPPDVLPDSVEALVKRCLEKDPSQRFASAKDLAFALESAAKNVTTSTPTPVRRVSHEHAPARRPWTRIAILLLIAGGIAAAAFYSRESPPPDPPRLRTLTWSGRDSEPAASPDGKIVAFVSTRDGARRIWLQQLDDGSEAPVTSGPNDAHPRFSPDGSAILFTRTANGASALYRVAIVGGEPRKLIDDAFDGDWSRDAKRIAFIRARTAGAERYSAVCVAPVEGGAVRELTSTPNDDLFSPRWSPDGARIAVIASQHGTQPASVMLVDAESGATKRIARTQRHGQLSAAAWTPDGAAVVYAELDALAGVGLPQRRGSSAIVRHDLRGDNTRVLLRMPHSAADTIDLLPDGRIVLTEDVTRQSLEEIALDGSAPPRWLSRGMSVDRQPAYARNGASVVFASDRGGNVDLWELALGTGRVHRLTDHAAVDWDPHPAPDGASLYWSSSRGGPFEIWTASIDGANPRQVTRDGVDAENPTLPASADWIYYDSSNPKRDGLWRVPRGGGDAQMVIAAETIHPEVSADGEYVVYQRPEAGGGASAIDVIRTSDRSVVTIAHGITGLVATRARWIGDSHTIAYRALDDDGRIAIFAQDLGSPTRRKLLTVEAETFAISPDGKRAIVSVIDEASGLMIAEGIAW